MHANRPPLTARALAAAALALLAAPVALADAHRATTPRATLPAYARECGACHLAYPPGLLPASSWQRLLGGLDRHFGTDASLDAATQREIGAWLQVASSGRGRAIEPPPEDRITRSRWFVHEHREAGEARRPGTRPTSPARCEACHAGAAQGRFDEDEVRDPVPSPAPAPARRP